MLSLRHETLVELFRNCGELAPELLRTRGITVAHEHVERSSIDLSQVTSTEYRADAVVELRDRSNIAVAAVVVEVQLYVDHDKEYSWPLYVAALRARLRCPVYLLVIAPDHAVARWARQPIELGHPGFEIAPLVIGFEDIPRVTDLDDARRMPELAVLSTLAHRELEVAEVALDAIEQLPEDQNRLYWDTIMAALPEAIRQILEARMQSHGYQSEFARRYYDQGHNDGQEKGREEGREEGREQGREQGREEGREEGRAEGLRVAVLALARAKLDAVTAADRARIEAVHDEDLLIELTAVLGQARNAADASAALDSVLGRERTT